MAEGEADRLVRGVEGGDVSTGVHGLCLKLAESRRRVTFELLDDLREAREEIERLKQNLEAFEKINEPPTEEIVEQVLTILGLPHLYSSDLNDALAGFGLKCSQGGKSMMVLGEHISKLERGLWSKDRAALSQAREAAEKQGAYMLKLEAEVEAWKDAAAQHLRDAKEGNTVLTEAREAIRGLVAWLSDHEDHQSNCPIGYIKDDGTPVYPDEPCNCLLSHPGVKAAMEETK